MAKTLINGQSVDYFVSPRWADVKSSKKNRQRSMPLKRAIRSHLQKTGLPFFNLTHTTRLGAFAASAGPVGIDIELRSRRVSERAAERIGTPIERKRANGPLPLWVIKEAAFKSIPRIKQPPTINHIEVFRISRTRLSKNLSFSFKTRRFNGLRSRGQGKLIIKSRYIMGIAVTNT